MDFTGRDTVAAGFDGVILIVREEIQNELMDHIGSFWPAEFPVVPVVQGAIAGTAQAVESARPFIDGPFGVANADDLYGAAALVTLADQLRDGTPGDHLLVGYHLRDTVLTTARLPEGSVRQTRTGFWHVSSSNACSASPTAHSMDLLSQAPMQADCSA